MSPDNFKHPRKHSKKPVSIDGFLAPSSFKKPHGSIEFKRRGRLGQRETSKIDDFDRPDGYHPTVPTLSGGEAQSPLLPDGARSRGVETVSEDVLPVPGAKKRRRLPKLLHRPKSWKSFFKRFALILGLLILLTGGFLAYKAYRTQRQIFSGGGQAPAVCDGNVPVEKLNKEGDGRVNILLVGIGGPGHPGRDLTDTLIIASMDTINDRVDLLSIPRDLWVQVPGDGTTKINAVYPFAKEASTSKGKDKIKDGLSKLDETLEKVAGITIHYNVLVDFKAFKDTVNAVGGVTFYVPETLYDPTIAWENNFDPTIAKKGNQTFTGARALLYARSRETSSDFARAERQRLLLVALKDKVLSLGTFSNPLKVSSLLDSLGNNVYTNFDLGSIKCLYEQGSQIQSANIKSLDLVTPPNTFVTTSNIGGLSVVIPKAGLFNYADIQYYVRNALRDSFLAKENANVTVLNGTNIAGLATQQSKLLKSFGYRVEKTGDAPSRNYQNTILVDLRDGANKYTLHYLEKRFGVEAVTKLPDGSIDPGTADFVIILGANAANSI